MCTNKTKFFKSVGTLLLTCLLAVLPSSVMARGFTVDGISYEVIGTFNQCQLYAVRDKSLSGDISIPETVEYEGIPYTVVYIGRNAFSDCSAITGIILPASVTKIWQTAFSNCSSLTSITIPESVIVIGKNPFEGCSSLSSIVVKEGNPVYDSRENCNAIIKTESNTLVSGCSTTKIPESVTSIGNEAFYGCSSLTSIAIPESVTSIGSEAFSGCSSLTSIAIPGSVTSIGGGAFEGCSSLTNAVLPESLTSIKIDMFRECSSLASITIPKSVTKINNNAFEGCSSLKEIICLAANPPSASRAAFKKLDTQNITLRVPNESLDAYKSTEPWNTFHIVGIDPTGINGVETENGNPTAIYSLDGKKVSETQKGRIYLHRYGNGKTVKRMAK